MNSLIENASGDGHMIKVRNFQALIDLNYKNSTDKVLVNNEGGLPSVDNTFAGNFSLPSYTEESLTLSLNEFLPSQKQISSFAN